MSLPLVSGSAAVLRAARIPGTCGCGGSCHYPSSGHTPAALGDRVRRVGAEYCVILMRPGRIRPSKWPSRSIRRLRLAGSPCRGSRTVSRLAAEPRYYASLVSLHAACSASLTSPTRAPNSRKRRFRRARPAAVAAVQVHPRYTAGIERQVSSYVATALEDYQERENLDDILAAWRAETPVPEEVRRQVETELDQAGLTGQPQQGSRMAG